MTISVGDFDPQDCTVMDEEGTVRVCDPRAWLLWMWAISNGLTYRTSPRGFQAWEVVDPDAIDRAYRHFSVAYSPMKQTTE